VTGDELLAEAEQILTMAGVDSARRDARLLLAAALDTDVARLALLSDKDVAEKAEVNFRNMIAARARRQPVAQILGYREFWGRRFRVTPDVLDPRADTETLIEQALNGPVPELLLDLGTGTGILAVTLLAEWPEAIGVATDISDKALTVARENAETLGVADRLTFIRSDWYANVNGKFDLVVSNPPYIAQDEMSHLEPEVREWEPALALTPGGDGLGAYRTIAAGLHSVLRPGGQCLVEIGYSQADSVCAIFREAGYDEQVIHRDLGGNDRVVAVKAAT
jgi:release factor glutamine methyltransferase